jgi:hypothetical protein
MAGFLVVSVVGLAGCGDDTPANTDVDLPSISGEQGFHFETDSVAIASGVEQQDCYFFQVPGAPGTFTYLHKFEVAQNPGSHHMNVFRVKTIKALGPETSPDHIVRSANGVGECFKSPNWSDWPLVVNSQQGGTVDWTLPDGVANKFEGGEWLMLQTHYVNALTQATPFKAHVEVNFYSMPAASVTAELGTIFATKQSIRICRSNPTPKFSGSCKISSTNPTTIVGANGHFHSRGKTFDIFKWDGTSTTEPPVADRFYESQAWDDPPMMHSPDLNQAIPAGGGVFYTCGFQWQEPPAPVTCADIDAADRAKGTPEDQLDCCYTFGGIVEKSEHCNAFIYYYPKSADSACF